MAELLMTIKALTGATVFFGLFVGLVVCAFYAAMKAVGKRT